MSFGDTTKVSPSFYCISGLSLFWTFCREYEFSLHDVVNLLCVNTASLAGFSERKGQIKEGYDADFVIWNPDDKFEVSHVLVMLYYCIHWIASGGYCGLRMSNQPLPRFLQSSQICRICFSLQKLAWDYF